jgi:hypothetical protein
MEGMSVEYLSSSPGALFRYSTVDAETCPDFQGMGGKIGNDYIQHISGYSHLYFQSQTFL